MVEAGGAVYQTNAGGTIQKGSAGVAQGAAHQRRDGNLEMSMIPGVYVEIKKGSTPSPLKCPRCESELKGTGRPDTYWCSSCRWAGLIRELGYMSFEEASKIE